MNPKLLKSAVALLAVPLLAAVTQPANATPVTTITGNFTVTSSSSDAPLSKEDLGGTLSNNNQKLSGALSPSLSLSLGVPVKAYLFDVSNNLKFNWWTTWSWETSTINVLFSGLSDGSAEKSCTSNTGSTDCSATATLQHNDTSLDLTPTSFLVDFADGAVLSIVDGCFEQGNDIKEQYTFTLIDGPTPVPEPASLALLGTALAGFGLLRWRRKRNAV